jgi:hypothetical protein
MMADNARALIDRLVEAVVVYERSTGVYAVDARQGLIEARAAVEAAINPHDREIRTGAHLLQAAKSLGWPDDGEGALEFMLRRAREVAFEDCGGVAQQQPEPVAWRYQRKDWGGIWRSTTVPVSFETPNDWTVQPLYTALSSTNKSGAT